ncbi:MAG: hypothetical protein IPK73_18665 [Candidatus Obscuribacter sp.]|nr:hypothetical protein [Candidatus Obscuribacter sp.]
MSLEIECRSSKLVDVLRHYGPIPRNDSQFDERVLSMHRKKGLAPFVFPSHYLEELVSNFRSDRPNSVILTGTAGDGKTYYCRKVWEELSGSSVEWSTEQRIQSLRIGSRLLTVVKDLSELQDHQKIEVILRLSRAVFEGCADELFLIAGNDGQLIDAFSSLPVDSNIGQLKRLVEDLLVDDCSSGAEVPLRLYNLSRLKTADVFPEILNIVLDHSGWSECEECCYGGQGTKGKVCPIFENRRRLSSEPILSSRLVELLRLCDLDGIHLPIRQQLILIANALLGHAMAADGLLKCKEVATVVNSGNASLGSIYSNIFGENLSERRRDNIDVFRTLNRFGIGSETSNRIDNLLIFGSDDANLFELFSSLVSDDSMYGADAQFLAKQTDYLEAVDLAGRADFLASLRRQRQRLFFVIPPERIDELGLWELTLFHSAGNYLDAVYRTLHDGRPVGKAILGKLVKGLNRVFTGFLASNHTELVLASSGHYSQARVCRVFEETVSVQRKKGEQVSIDMNPGWTVPKLIVTLSAAPITAFASLDLSLTRFEYIVRVADGALPTSFSQECYEDLLAFKARILRKVSERRIRDAETDDGDLSRMDLRLLEINSEGSLSDRQIEVTFC